MDKHEIEIAERVYQKIKSREGLPDVMIAQEILTKEEKNDSIVIKKVKKITDILINAGLLSQRANRTGYFIYPSTYSANFDSFKDFLNYQLESKAEKEKEKARLEKKHDLEIENLELQILHQKQWFWKVDRNSVV